MQVFCSLHPQHPTYCFFFLINVSKAFHSLRRKDFWNNRFFMTMTGRVRGAGQVVAENVPRRSPGRAVQIQRHDGIGARCSFSPWTWQPEVLPARKTEAFPSPSRWWCSPETRCLPACRTLGDLCRWFPEPCTAACLHKQTWPIDNRHGTLADGWWDARM